LNNLLKKKKLNNINVRVVGGLPPTLTTTVLWLPPWRRSFDQFFGDPQQRFVTRRRCTIGCSGNGDGWSYSCSGGPAVHEGGCVWFTWIF